MDTNDFYDSSLVPDCISFMRIFVKLFLEYGYKVGKKTDQSLDIANAAVANEILDQVYDPNASDEEIIRLYRVFVKQLITEKDQSALLIPLALSIREFS